MATWIVKAETAALTDSYGSIKFEGVTQCTKLKSIEWTKEELEAKIVAIERVLSRL